MSRAPRERWTPAYDRMFDPGHELAYGPTCPRFAWLDLCHNARWEDGTRIIKGVAVPLRRGEVLVSLRWMAERWGWSTKKVRSFVNLLTSPQIAKLETVRETPQGTVYRIVNYDSYANAGHTIGHSKAHTRGTPGAHPGHKEQQGKPRDTMGEGAHAHDAAGFDPWEHLDAITALGIRAKYGGAGREGTDEAVWRGASGIDRDRVLTIAVTRWVTEKHDEYNAKLFRRILETVIAEQASHDERPGGDPLWA